jgi:hypothetical protein
VIATKTERTAPANGNELKTVNGAAALRDSPVAATQARIELGSQHAAGLPHMIVVQPRAAGYGGFAR